MITNVSTWSVIALSVLSLAAPGCATVEGTGRTQLMLISAPQEQALGAEAYEEILSKERISDDERMTRIVRRVGERIAAVADQPDFDWEFNVIDSEQINAFCLPGGKIAVYTGILPIMKNEAGLAAVMGHEVAHAVARHGGERISQQLGAQLALELASAGLGEMSPKNKELALGALGAGVNVGVMLPFSRSHELEADELGLDLAAEAGYDPREAVRLWERMEAAGKGKPPEFLSTHPHEQRRISELQAQMPDALRHYEAAPHQHGLGETW